MLSDIRIIINFSSRLSEENPSDAMTSASLSAQEKCRG